MYLSFVFENNIKFCEHISNKVIRLSGKKYFLNNSPKLGQ